MLTPLTQTANINPKQLRVVECPPTKTSLADILAHLSPMILEEEAQSLNQYKRGKKALAGAK
jgi:hypothetical protein